MSGFQQKNSTRHVKTPEKTHCLGANSSIRIKLRYDTDARMINQEILE